jgi:hypothetical protein
MADACGAHYATFMLEWAVAGNSINEPGNLGNPVNPVNPGVGMSSTVNESQYNKFSI